MGSVGGDSSLVGYQGWGFFLKKVFHLQRQALGPSMQMWIYPRELSEIEEKTIFVLSLIKSFKKQKPSHHVTIPMSHRLVDFM